MNYTKLILPIALGVVLVVPYTALAHEGGGNVGHEEFKLGRPLATVAVVIGLISVALAVRAFMRKAKSSQQKRRDAIIAGGIGLVVTMYAIVHLTIFTGALGTGDGRGGAIPAMILGVVAMILAGATLIRTRRMK